MDALINPPINSYKKKIKTKIKYWFYFLRTHKIFQIFIYLHQNN